MESCRRLLGDSQLCSRASSGSRHGGGGGALALSALIAVLTFYRDDDALLAGAILSVITGVGSVMAWALAVVATTRSLGAVIVAAAGGALIFPLHLILMALLFAGLVWILRKFRRWLAPDTSVDS